MKVGEVIKGKWDEFTVEHADPDENPEFIESVEDVLPVVHVGLETKGDMLTGEIYYGVLADCTVVLGRKKISDLVAYHAASHSSDPANLDDLRRDLEKAIEIVNSAPGEYRAWCERQAAKRAAQLAAQGNA